MKTLHSCPPKECQIFPKSIFLIIIEIWLKLVWLKLIMKLNNTADQLANKVKWNDEGCLQGSHKNTKKLTLLIYFNRRFTRFWKLVPIELFTIFVYIFWEWDQWGGGVQIVSQKNEFPVTLSHHKRLKVNGFFYLWCLKATRNSLTMNSICVYILQPPQPVA